MTTNTSLFFQNSRNPNNSKSSTKIAIVLAMAMAIAGGALSYWVAQRADLGMRNSLLHQADMITGAIAHARIKTLTGTEADAASPDYQRLKTQLGAIKAAGKNIRSLSLLGCRPGAGPTSPPEVFPYLYVKDDSRKSSPPPPPGAIYASGSMKLHPLLNREQTLVKGPFPDQWGACISVLMPIVDRETGGVFALLYMTVDARDWHWKLAKAATPPALVTLALGTILLTVIMARRRKTRPEHLATEHSQKLVLIKDAIESASDAVGISTIHGRHFFQNKAFTELFGYQLSEIQSFHPAILYADQAVAGKVFKTILAGREWTGEIEMLTRDRGKIQVFLRATASRDENGKVIALLGMHTDITLHKNNEKELLKRNQQLKEASARAEVANLAKSEFLNNMSHEIRTPMNGIIGMSELLQGTDLTPEQQQYMDTMHACENQLLELTEDILDFSRVEAGRQHQEILDFDLPESIEEVTDIFATRAKEKGLDISCFVAPEIPPLLQGDPGRLRQVLIKFVDNAIKFTATGKVDIRAELAPHSANNLTLRFMVEDTGIGIPADKSNLLFKPFSQIDTSTTRKFGGTGLGLAISSKLVKSMGGEIGANSVEGEGSTFWFTAPLRKQPHTPRLKSNLDHLHHFPILVVDDHAANRFSFDRCLAAWGCNYQFAETAKTAIESLRQAQRAGHPFKLAFIDQLMPDENALDFCRRVKADQTLTATKLIVLTSSTKPANQKHLAEAGFARSLHKPIRQSHLLRCLEAMAGKPEPKSKQVEQADRPQNLHVLVVEDNPVNQMVTKGILEKKFNIQTDVAANGAEGIEALRKFNYDLVLMDCQMPVMDGYEATRVIRNPQSGTINPDVYIIALTANTMKSDRQKCQAVGMNDFLAKPLNPDHLNTAIQLATTMGKKVKTRST